ncbi:unnamed protein product [Acanthoscelides obtectus]|uniref:Uncharacterized protein n=1 Tax=Acanthoscelides obtectus TaxID=200917 RepID=A0A9P0LML0_ACAOB|nr:unnamed protein product [Acanthoscelides obtectus]CAK1655747.1 hypothetical protein AOBTE_LOCUS19297 [Acanthoscelides obtectus]
MNVWKRAISMNFLVEPVIKKSAFWSIIGCTYSIFNIQRGVRLVKLNVRVSPSNNHRTEK